MKTFADGFVWGVSTSGRQIEPNFDRGPDIWDPFAQIPGTIQGGYSADVTCNHISHVDRDVGLINQLGVAAYRFSIAWPRWMTEGQGNVNPAGVSFYDRLVDKLLAVGVQPWVTLYHWDLPLALEQKGGWLNRDTVNHFADYAQSVARKLGDRVKDWMTINEPNIISFQGYVKGEFAPGMRSWPAAFRVVHHLLLAHGMGMAAVRQEHSDTRVGIVLKMLPVETSSGNPWSRLHAHIWRTLGTNWFLDPLLRGSYPTLVRTAYRVMKEVIRPGDMEVIRPKRQMDFIGIDYYFRQVIDFLGRWRMHVHGSQHTAMDWEICADAFARGLIHLKEEYGKLLPPVYITENGAAFEDYTVAGRMNDQLRINYLTDHLIALLRAIAAGVDVRGYFVWSLIDNWEWSKGFTKRFGLVHVDYLSRERTRTPKDSFYWYKEVISHNGLTV
jgi:beta-glucosidase